MTELAEDAVRLDCRIKRCGAMEQTAIRPERFMRQRHDAGVTHKDLSVRNIPVKNSVFNFLLLDYEDARFSMVVSKKQRLDHLHERALGQAKLRYRLDFLRAYLDGQDSTGSRCKELRKLIVKYPSKYTICAAQ